MIENKLGIKLREFRGRNIKLSPCRVIPLGYVAGEDVIFELHSNWMP